MPPSRAVLAQGRSLLVLVSLVCRTRRGEPAQAQGQASTREFRATRTAPANDRRTAQRGGLVAGAGHVRLHADRSGRRSSGTERTEVRVLYDDRALYVGVRLFDHDTVHLGRRLSTRDGDDADRVTLYLDMHDHLTGVMFRVSASNVQTDAVLFNDTWDDWSWNGVWQSDVSVDEGGWSVEMRIPLSQLRFTSDDVQTWGINVERYIRRRNEGSWLEMVPKKETGRASRMVHLTGLDGLKPSRRLELLPYTAGRAEYVAPASTVNPFNDGSRVFASAGLDMKCGLTSNLTVDATVNPDFGQVEVDPAVVNLQRVRNLLRGEARVLPRRRADLQQLRTRRLERQLGLQQLRAADLLFAAHRPRRSSSPMPSSPIRRRQQRSSAPRS